MKKVFFGASFLEYLLHPDAVVYKTSTQLLLHKRKNDLMEAAIWKL